ncbi:FAD/NAD(P)-binding domain-containing protein [Periconia macrospinosa]|uniref:FAD/NAD(P)-binding domain-containing protein n=1 Tax=Periconia macrospinosa TaxID=97972 RepID=A0A2V1E6N8_9PLEO|nr:FAD/NAD(P)-binding domain-containing protein [Periconia macrospinosa]
MPAAELSTTQPQSPASLPVLIVGAGISGLLLAQHLSALSVPFVLLERDASPATDRGAGWGLTLNWSLPALRELLPPALAARLPETYVDRALTVKKSPRFPFYDLATGEMKGCGPVLEPERVVRVSRRRLRDLLATGLEVGWGREVLSFAEEEEECVVAHLVGGGTVVGKLMVACDGAHSRIRQALLPHAENHLIPVGAMGLRMEHDPEQVKSLRALDPFFLHGTSSVNNSFAYFSLLETPDDPGNERGKYIVQLVVSWPLVEGFLGRPTVTTIPDTNRARLTLIRAIAQTWADPFRQIALELPENTEVKPILLDDWPPPRDFQTTGRIALMGDAMHPMAMYRGEGANHAIVDVKEFSEHVLPSLRQDLPSSENLRGLFHRYNAAVVERARPGVLASRRACIDAHDWVRVGSPEVPSPLLTPRIMRLRFDEGS